MMNPASNRSPSPLSARNCRNSETNTTTRRSFSGNPFTRPNAVVNPRGVIPPTPANTPATTDHMKRGSLLRKSTGSSMFQDGKENHKDVIRSPARSYEKSFMAPTISAASKFTPSPRKKVLGEKNEVARTSIQFLDKDFIMKPEAIPLDQPNSDDVSDECVALEQKEVVLETPPVRKVTFASINDEPDVTVIEDYDLVKIRPFCCSPQTSPIIAPLDADPLPPYDPKKNFLSPRPQFLRYKPNPRIELLLNKVDANDGYGEDDVMGLEDAFNLSDNSSDTEQEPAKQKEEEEEEDKEVKVEEVEEKLEDLCRVSSDKLSEIVSEEKQSDSKLIKTASKPRFFTRSKTILFISVLFLVACFSVSFTDSPPMDLPIHKDVSFSEIYDESSKLASSAKESFDGFVENLKKWSNHLVSYLSHHISHFSSTQNSVQFFNLTPSSIQEEWQIVADHADVEISEEIQEFEEEIEENYEMMEEEVYEEMEADVEDEVSIEVPNEIQSHEQIHTHDDDFLEKSLNLEDESSEIASISVSKSETAVNDLEIESSVADTSAESETLTSSLTKSVNPIFLAGFSTVIVAIAAIFYTIKRKSSVTTSTARVTKRRKELQEESSCSSETSVQKGYKKKSNNKRDSLASSSEFSMGGSASYGSFTTFEKIPIKHRDEAMLTPIRRSSRLVKSQVPSFS